MSKALLLAIALLLGLGCSGPAAGGPKSGPGLRQAPPRTQQPPRSPKIDAGVDQAAHSGSGGDASLPAVVPKEKTTPPGAVSVDATEFVRFAPGSARLTRASRSALDRMVEMIKGSPGGGVIKIEGHCDRAERNKAVLSLKRARRVKRYLVRKGVKAERLKAVGYGSTRPVASSETAEGRQQNRRVDFSFVEQTY